MQNRQSSNMGLLFIRKVVVSQILLSQYPLKQLKLIVRLLSPRSHSFYPSYAMVLRKSRLYLALYARSGASEPYYQALIVGPKDEAQGAQGKRYYIKNQINPETGRKRQVYKEFNVLMQLTGMLLVHILIAKVEKPNRLRQLLSRVTLVQDDIDQNCKNQVKDSLRTLEEDGKSLGTAQTDQAYVQQIAYQYIDLKKSQKRFDSTGDQDVMKVLTFDVLVNQETIE